MYRIVQTNANTTYGITQFVSDTVEDLNDLPKCQMGSICFVISTNEKYMLDGAEKWTLVKNSNSGSSGGGDASETDMSPLTEQEVLDICQ